jgi:hypothetical protein
MVAQRGFAANRNGASDPYQGTTSVVLFCQPAGNDGNENKEFRHVFSGVPTIMAGVKGFSPWCPTCQNRRGAQRFV